MGTDPVARRGKDPAIETLRAVAIVLMVAGHVIGGTAADGLQLSDGSVGRWVYVGLEDIRMPLFTVLSGFVYARRPTRRATYDVMLLGKVRRLLVPLLTVGSVFFLMQIAVPGTNSPSRVSEIWMVPLYGYGPYWFLLSIFLIFAVVGLLDVVHALDSIRTWAAAVVVSGAAYVLISPDGLSLFSISGALRLLPFFLIGYGLHRFGSPTADSPRMFAGIAALLTVLYAARIATVVGDRGLAPVSTRALGLVVGVAAVVLLMALRHRLSAPPLAWLGQFSFAVYLLHVFGAAGSRILLDRVGVSSPVLIFVVALVVAIAVPVAFELTLGRVRMISWAVLGQRPRVARAFEPAPRSSTRTPVWSAGSSPPG